MFDLDSIKKLTVLNLILFSAYGIPTGLNAVDGDAGVLKEIAGRVMEYVELIPSPDEIMEHQNKVEQGMKEIEENAKVRAEEHDKLMAEKRARREAFEAEVYAEMAKGREESRRMREEAEAHHAKVRAEIEAWEEKYGDK